MRGLQESDDELEGHTLKGCVSGGHTGKEVARSVQGRRLPLDIHLSGGNKKGNWEPIATRGNCVPNCP